MENDKLVRLSDVIETIENQCSDGNMWGNENLTLIDASKTIDEISDIPAVDAVEVRHARWEGNYPRAMFRLKRCSACEKLAPEGWYCFFCGASMDGEEETQCG